MIDIFATLTNVSLIVFIYLFVFMLVFVLYYTITEEVIYYSPESIFIKLTGGLIGGTFLVAAFNVASYLSWTTLK